MENKEYGVVYLMQLHINFKGKDVLFKYVGQTINLDKRIKQHIRDFKKKDSSKVRMYSQSMRKIFNVDAANWWDNLNVYWEALQFAINNNQWNFTIVSKAKDKAELNCLEFANMFIFEPQLNSYESEANCKNINCHVCSEWMLWGLHRMMEFGNKWHWPERSFFNGNTKNERIKRLSKKINGLSLSDEGVIRYTNKWKAGFIHKDSEKLWGKK